MEQEKREAFELLFNRLLKEVKEKNGKLVYDDIAKEEMYKLFVHVVEISFDTVLDCVPIMISVRS